jgi:hypothetical protein
VVIDGGMDVVVADAQLPLRCALTALWQHAGAPAAAVGDLADLLDVDVHQLAGPGAFVAGSGVPAGADQDTGQRVALGQSRHPMTGQDPAYGALGDTKLGRDPARPALRAGPLGQHPRLDRGRGAARARMRT